MALSFTRGSCTVALRGLRSRVAVEYPNSRTRQVRKKPQVRTLNPETVEPGTYLDQVIKKPNKKWDVGSGQYIKVKYGL